MKNWKRAAIPVLVTLLLVACATPTPTPSPSPAPAANARASAAPDAALAAARPGQPCLVDEQVLCNGERTAIACIEHTWRSARCRGATGCVRSVAQDAAPPDDLCDQLIADEHEVCVTRDDFTCAADGKALLACENHAWRTRQRCGGQNACTVKGKRVVCDNSVANVGDACIERDDYACATDLESALRCDGGTFTLASRCEGPKGCAIARSESGARVECDDSISAVGSACDREGHYSCSVDLTRILVCRAHHFVSDDACKKRERCAIRGGQVGCY